MSKDLEKVESKKEVKNTKKVSEKKSTVKKSASKSSSKTTKKASSSKVKEAIDNSITLEEADSFYHVSLLAQAACVIGVLFISVLALFEHSFTVPIEVLVGVTLLIMAYNNIKLFKRKGLTAVYIIFGIISLFVGILGYFGVTL